MRTLQKWYLLVILLHLFPVVSEFLTLVDLLNSDGLTLMLKRQVVYLKTRMSGRIVAQTVRAEYLTRTRNGEERRRGFAVFATFTLAKMANDFIPYSPWGRLKFFGE